MGYYVGQAPAIVELRPPADSNALDNLRQAFDRLTTGDNRGSAMVFAAPMQITRLSCSYCGYAGNRESACPKCGASE